MADPLTIAVATLAVAGTAASIAGQRRQAKAAERAAGEQRKQNAISNAQESIARNRRIRQAIAQTRVQQAQQLQAGFSSGFAGAVSAIGSDAASAIGAAQTQQAAAFGISQSQNRESQFRLEATNPNTFTQLGTGLRGLSGALSTPGLSSAFTQAGGGAGSGSN